MTAGSANSEVLADRAGAKRGLLHSEVHENEIKSVLHAAEHVAYPAILRCLQGKQQDAGAPLCATCCGDPEFKAHAITLRLIALLLAASRLTAAASIGGEAARVLDVLRASKSVPRDLPEALARVLRLDRGWFYVCSDHHETLDGLRGCEQALGGALRECAGLWADDVTAHALHGLMHARLAGGDVLQIDYARVDPCVLGRVHERWLAGRHREGHAESRRSRQGAFYTPASLVSHVLDRTIDPLFAIGDAGRLQHPLPRVIDPAVGSGEFLRAAVIRLADHWRASEDCLRSPQLVDAVRRLYVNAGRKAPSPMEPSDGEQCSIAALRSIAATQCVYGVDIDPLAVQITRFVLWLEATTNGEQLPAIAAHIRHGNALRGDGHQALCDVRDARDAVQSDRGSLDFHWKSQCAEIFESVRDGRATSGNAAEQGDPGVYCGQGFDAVIGNPPFVDSESMSREDPEQRAWIASRYKTARGNWDLYVPFVELAMNITRRGGNIALVTPSRIVAADYAVALQTEMLKLTINDCTDFAATTHFDGASIAVAVLSMTNTPADDDHHAVFTQRDTSGAEISSRHVSLGTLRELPPGCIGAALWARDESELKTLAHGVKLGMLATLSDGATTAEAYKIGEHIVAVEELSRRSSETTAATDGCVSTPEGPVSDDSVRDTDGYVRLINTGTIDPYSLHWGWKPTRYLGKTVLRPVITEAELGAISTRRLLQARSMKVVVAGLAGLIEAAVAPQGWLCGKSAVAVIPHESICPYALCAVLNSTQASAMYRMLFGHRGFSSRSLAIGPRQLERLAMPDARLLAHAAGPFDQRGLEHAIARVSGQPDAQAEFDRTIADFPSAATLLSHLGRMATEAAMQGQGESDARELVRLVEMIDRCVDAAYAISRR